MKGIVLAGGVGSRLFPLTKTTNKHLLPIYDKPMIYYPIQTLVDSGIKDIMIVCGGNAAGEFLRILGNGEVFGLKNLAYSYQDRPAGIAHALGLAEEWVGKDKVCVILADNVYENPVTEAVQEFNIDGVGARIFVTQVEHPEWYGVVESDNNGNVLNIVEKPKEPKSNLIATGLYLYDNTVWDYIRSLSPSKRNELEITDLNNRYLSLGQLKVHRINGYWMDCGESLEGYMQACIRVYQSKTK